MVFPPFRGETNNQIKPIKSIKQIKPILEHNQQHFFSSKNRIENFVKYIYGADPAYNWLKDCKYD